MIRKVFAVCAVAVLLTGFALAADEPAASGAEQSSAKTPIAVGIFGGYMLGDQVSEKTFSFYNQKTPLEIDDFPVIGAFMTTAVSPGTDFEVRLGVGKTTFLHVPTRKRDMVGEPIGKEETEDAYLYYLNVGFIPKFNLGKIKLGVPFGVGWGQSSAEENLSGEYDLGMGEGNKLDGGGGMLIYAGLQGSLPVSDRWAVVADARMQRFHRLVNVTEKSALCFEFTIGVKRSF